MTTKAQREPLIEWLIDHDQELWARGLSYEEGFWEAISTCGWNLRSWSTCCTALEDARIRHPGLRWRGRAWALQERWGVRYSLREWRKLRGRMSEHLAEIDDREFDLWTFTREISTPKLRPRPSMVAEVLLYMGYTVDGAPERYGATARKAARSPAVTAARSTDEAERTLSIL